MSATLIVGMLAAAMMQQTDTTFAVRSNSLIEVETFGGEINVKGWNRNEVRVQAAHGRRDIINIEARGNSVSIEAEGRVGPAVDVTFNVWVPASSSLDLSGVHTEISVDGVTGDVDAETVQGSIRVVGGGRLKLESVEGNIIIDRARGRVSANTVNRGVRITNTVGDVEAETVNGPIILKDVQAASVDLATVNGRIVYDGTLRSGGDYSITTHNGGIWVVIPEKVGVTVDVSTFNGDLDSTLPITFTGDRGSKRRMNFVFGNGGARLDLESFGGDIYLRRPGENIPLDLESSRTPRAPKPPKVRVN